MNPNQNSNTENVQISNPKSLFSIFPNPTNGTFNILRESYELCSIQVMDIVGRIIFKKENVTGQEINFDLSQQSSDVYMVKIQTENKTEMHKIIKN